MTDTTADILRKAKAHISDPAMWNQDGGFFRSSGGKSFTDYDEDFEFITCPACAFGAIQFASMTDDYPRVDRIMENACYEIVGTRDVVFYNDCPTTTHADIMALFDRAIQLAEAEQ